MKKKSLKPMPGMPMPTPSMPMPGMPMPMPGKKNLKPIVIGPLLLALHLSVTWFS